MIFNNYRGKFNILISLNIILMLLLFSSKSFSVPMVENEIKYRITELQSEMVDSKKSSVDINVLERTITLKNALVPPDLLKFADAGMYDFVILDNDGLNHYAFDGVGYTELSSLNIPVSSPYGIAVDSYDKDYPSYYISRNDADDSGNVSHYYYDANDGMAKSPMLDIAGMDFIVSLSTFKDTGELALLTEDKFTVNSIFGSIPEFEIDVVSPLSLATGSGYHFAILNDEKIEHYMFDSTAITNIPALEIALDKNIEDPKSIVITDDTTYLLADDEVKAYTFDGSKMEYNAALSITGLTDPKAMALNTDNNGLIILDYIENQYITNYYALSESGYVNIPSLSVIIDEIINGGSSGGGKKYKTEGTLYLGPFEANSAYVNLLKVKAYTETPKGTKIDFSVANTLGGDGNPIWIKSWSVYNYSSDSVVGNLIKYSAISDEMENAFLYGNSTNGFPSAEDLKFEGDNDYVVVDGDVPVISNPTYYDKKLWTPLDTKGNSVWIKVDFSTDDESQTPVIFAPMGINNVNGISASDDVAIHIEANARPTKPNIEDVTEPWETPPQTPGPGELKFEPMAEWVYTTTPKIKWTFTGKGFDDDAEEGTQEAFQVVLLSKVNESWKVIYDTDIVLDSGENSFTISTSDLPFEDGFMWNSDSYRYGVAVRVWDDNDGVSDFSDVSTFNVLAFERPRIVNIINPPSTGDSKNNPQLNDVATHRLITSNMKDDELIDVKAGSQVTMIIDSVGPVESLPDENAFFYVDIGGKEVKLNMLDSYAINPLGLASNRNRWMFNFYTEAPIIKIPDNTIVKARIAGRGEIGGTTIFYIPNYSEGVVRTKDSVYSDWQVIIQGRDRD